MIVTATPASNHFLRKPAFRKGEKRDQKWARNPGPFLEPSSIGTITEGSENGPIFGPAFRCRKTTLELVLGVAKSGHGSRNTVQCHQFFPRCSWISEAPQLLLVLNTHSLSTVKLKPAAYSRTKCSCNSADYLASFDQLHSCTALLLSLSLILQQLRLSCWLREQERNCERL